MSEKLVYTSAELADVLGVSLPTLREVIRSNNPPPFVRLGRKYVFPVAEVSDWLGKAAKERTICRG